MIVTTNRMFWRPTACAYRCAVRVASGLELVSMERSSSSSWGSAILWVAASDLSRGHGVI
jgi:hypothetical protein